MHVVTKVCDTSERGHLRIKLFDLKGSPDQSHFIFEINVGESRI